jgi:hypothetical protein
LVFPTWWTPEHAKTLQFVPSEVARDWKVVRSEADLDEMIDDDGNWRFVRRTRGA